LGQANEGAVNITIDDAVAETVPPDSTFRVQRSFTTAAMESRNVQVAIRAASMHGTVSIASIPAIPVRR
jgi:hypothetical protein